MDSLKHQQCSPQISPAVLCNSLVQGWNLVPAFPFTHVVQDVADLSFRWRCNSNEQRSAANRSNDVACRVGQENEPQVRTVLLHRPPERGLCISCQMIRFIDHNNLEALLCSHIDLLCLRNLLEQVLDDYPVVVADI